MVTIFMASLGCAKNLVDAETMLGETLGGEFGLAVDPEMADCIIINTCGFIQDARDEARQVIGEYLQLKVRSRRTVKVVAAGCWAQREPERLLEEFPALDGVWGLNVPSALSANIHALFAPEHRPAVCGAEREDRLPREGARLVTTLPSYAYIRLSDGCDNRCHYCAIPLIRGPLRSRKPEEILDEAKSLEAQGARELVLISQDTTAYGQDLRQSGLSLATLLEKLLRAVNIPRLRLLYAHPAHLEPAVMDILVQEPRFLRYLDLPVQHFSDRVLAAMGRGYRQKRIVEVVEKLTAADFTLRTTVLAGYPGETEEDFRQVLEMVGKGYFRHLGAFAYSPEPDTVAFGLADRVPAEVAVERRDAIMDAQSRNAFAWLDSRIGGREEILADSRADGEWLVGRSRHEAPDADNVVYLNSRTGAPGDVISACIAGREGYDLVAEPVKGGTKRRGSRR